MTELEEEMEKPQSYRWENFYTPLSVTNRSSGKIPSEDTKDLSKMIN